MAAVVILSLLRASGFVDRFAEGLVEVGDPGAEFGERRDVQRADRVSTPSRAARPCVLT